MSAEELKYVPADADVMSQLATANAFYFIGFAILYYDHFLTFGEELRVVWKRPKRPGAYWFFINRYFAFFANIAVTVCQHGKLGFTPKQCKSYSYFGQLHLVVTQILVGNLLTMRVYALYECSKRILGFMIVVMICGTSVAVWSILGTESMPADTITGCHMGLTQDSGIRLAAAWIGLFVFDSIAFILTARKSYREMYMHQASRSSSPLLWIVIRDGALYFAIMALANMANIVTFCVAKPFVKSSLSGFSSNISVTAMSRLMLNLHARADAGISTIGQPRIGRRGSSIVLDSAGMEFDEVSMGRMYESAGDTSYGTIGAEEERGRLYLNTKRTSSSGTVIPRAGSTTKNVGL